MPIFKKVILKICIILLGGLILFNIAFASSKGYYHKYTSEYTQGGVRILPSNLTEKQYFAILAHGSVPLQLTLLSDYKYNPNYLFGLPENTIYFIYSGYFFLLLVFVTSYTGMFGRTKVKENKENLNAKKLKQEIELIRKNIGKLSEEDMNYLLELSGEAPKT